MRKQAVVKFIPIARPDEVMRPPVCINSQPEDEKDFIEEQQAQDKARVV
jgi:hypothetical protein